MTKIVKIAVVRNNLPVSIQICRFKNQMSYFAIGVSSFETDSHRQTLHGTQKRGYLKTSETPSLCFILNLLLLYNLPINHQTIKVHIFRTNNLVATRNTIKHTV
jgi:hypothetical protein